jgi:hypothetical protein
MGIPMSGLWAATLIQHVTLAINRLQVVMSKKLVREEPFKYFDVSFHLPFNIDRGLNVDYFRRQL